MADIVATAIVLLVAVTSRASVLAYPTFCYGELGYFPDPSDCRNFVHCKSHKMAYITPCFEDRGYDVTNKKCVHKEDVPYCNVKTGIPYSPPHVAFTDVTDLSEERAFCALSGSGVYYNPTDCQRGIVCYGNKLGYAVSCEGGYGFVRRPIGCKPTLETECPNLSPKHLETVKSVIRAFQ